MHPHFHFGFVKAAMSTKPASNLLKKITKKPKQTGAVAKEPITIDYGKLKDPVVPKPPVASKIDYSDMTVTPQMTQEDIIKRWAEFSRKGKAAG